MQRVRGAGVRGLMQGLLLPSWGRSTAPNRAETYHKTFPPGAVRMCLRGQNVVLGVSSGVSGAE